MRAAVLAAQVSPGQRKKDGVPDREPGNNDQAPGDNQQDRDPPDMEVHAILSHMPKRSPTGFIFQHSVRHQPGHQEK
jgi:hypothetical protein